MPTKKKTPKIEFEQGMQQLNELVEALEGGELTLEQSLKTYEQSVELSKQLNEILDQGEATIKKLIGESGSFKQEEMKGVDVS